MAAGFLYGTFPISGVENHLLPGLHSLKGVSGFGPCSLICSLSFLTLINQPVGLRPTQSTLPSHHILLQRALSSTFTTSTTFMLNPLSLR
jgi:hypothetical protein